MNDHDFIDDEPVDELDETGELDETDELDEETGEFEDETDFATVATGATLDEAKRNALQQLRKIVPSVTQDDIEYEVVDEAVKGGFLGRGRMLARVEARVRPSASSGRVADTDRRGTAAGRRRAAHSSWKRRCASWASRPRSR